MGLLLLVLGCREAAQPAPTVPPPAQPAQDAGAASSGAQTALLESPGALVLSLGGVVEVRRVGSDEWSPLTQGDAVELGDQVRTGQDGHLELSFDVAEINLKADSGLELTLLEPREVRATVTGAADGQLPGGELSFFAGDAVASTRGGRVAISFDGRTAVASAMKGRARVTARGGAVELREGQFSVVKEAGPTGPPLKMPKAVALDVSWPPETETNKPELSIKGRASPLSRVSVAGRRVEVADDGTFVANLTLKRGPQKVLVVAVDAFGRRATRVRQFVMDPEAPSIKGRAEPYQ